MPLIFHHKSRYCEGESILLGFSASITAVTRFIHMLDIQAMKFHTDALGKASKLFHIIVHKHWSMLLGHV